MNGATPFYQECAKNLPGGQFRAYQPAAIDWISQRRRGLVKGRAGCGKTLIAAAAIYNVYRRRPRTEPIRIGWLANTIEQCQQAHDALDLFPMNAERHVACAAGAPDFSGDDVLIVDECFPAGVLVDGVPIERIRIGDEVRCLDHDLAVFVRRKVRRVFRSVPSAMVRVWLTDGQSIACTPGHPFWTGSRYTPAHLLTSGSMVCSITRYEDMLRLRMRSSEQGARSQVLLPRVPSPAGREPEDHCSGKLRGVLGSRGLLGHQAGIQVSGDGEEESRLLLGGVQGCPYAAPIVGEHGANESSLRVGQDEEAQSDEERDHSRENVNDAQGYAVEAAHPGRQRSRTNHGGDASCECPWMAGERDREDALDAAVASISLQGRCGERGAKGGDRGGRHEPLRQCGQGEGREEIIPSIFTGVDRVEVLEPTSDGTFGGVCPDGFVYNIEVEEHHNYLANGIVVHNCHHAISPLWTGIIERARAKALWGFTATPHDDDEEKQGFLLEIFGDLYAIDPAEVAKQLARGRVILLNDTDPGLREPMDVKIEEELVRLAGRMMYVMKDKLWQKHGQIFCEKFQIDAPPDESWKEVTRRGLYQRAMGFLVTALKQELWPRVAHRVCLDMGIAQNRRRNDAIVAAAMSHPEATKLVLVNNKEHGGYLAENVPGAVVCHSKMGVRKRREAMAGLRDGSVKCAMLTSLADEGLDVPRASILINACGGRSPRAAEQRTGRVLRSDPGKVEGLIYDFTDADVHPLMAKQSKARQAVYARLGYTIETATRQIALL